jgi:hypothetical protein
MLFLLKSTLKNILPRRFLRNTLILKFLLLQVLWSYNLFKISEVIYDPSLPDLG